MAISQEVRLLTNSWNSGTKWPKRLESLKIKGLRGWEGQQINFAFPIVALVGENGSGKSTVLQAAASVYRNDEKIYASDFFPNTPFETIKDVVIEYTYKQGSSPAQTASIRKPTDRWLGNPNRPERPVAYIDLNRIQPVSKRTGFTKLLKSGVTGSVDKQFSAADVNRLSYIIGKTYEAGNISRTNADSKRKVPVLKQGTVEYSGFHQGAGELAAAELLAQTFPKYGLILIDEIETSLHPRAQRRLLRDLAAIAREQELQIVITTHSPYILAELPDAARLYIMQGSTGKSVVTGVSPEFAMTKMDEERVPECDIYVEDKRAAAWVTQTVAIADRELARRTQLIPFGGSQVGVSLGTMKAQNRFPRRALVFLDGNEVASQGTLLLPGGDAPERVVFGALSTKNWPGVSTRISRPPSETIDALNEAMLNPDEHRWPSDAADRLDIGADQLWDTLCMCWALDSDNHAEVEAIAGPIRNILELPFTPPR
ncbi:ATP-dependent nuclease [Stenotrophomonas hibiscicola]|uniref:ATP-dependent nuclease n=1 Tax=Stenotrophomonas hibiscicola TaxID=86189 RepID=UPI002E76641D|nr:AAA family ATPase [[Pseudomonas] hibiscicola]